MQFVNWKSQSSQQMEKLNENIMKKKQNKSGQPWVGNFQNDAILSIGAHMKRVENKIRIKKHFSITPC